MSGQGPITTTNIRQLYEFACTPFVLSEFRRRWQSYGWRYEPEPGDEFGFTVVGPDSWPLTVDPVGKQVIGASSPFYYWEEYHSEFHENHEEYERQRKTYDEVFETVKSDATAVLPPPVQHWTDQDKDAHKATIWEGTHGMLILQQACFDCQFGIEINFWLTGCARDEFVPTTPLIDWLGKRSGRLHDEMGFPGLEF